MNKRNALLPLFAISITLLSFGLLSSVEASSVTRLDDESDLDSLDEPGISGPERNTVLTNQTKFKEIIEDSSSESAAAAFDDLLPDIIGNAAPQIVNDLDTKSSEELAEESLGTIFDIVEVSVFEQGTDFVFDNFFDRIIQLLTNGFGNVIDRTTAELEQN